MTHLSLFTGIGGIDIAAEWAGFESVGQVEFADYPTKILEKHWPNIPRWRDIRTLTKESFYERTGLRTVDVVSGGFPCQPFSVAGKQEGERDDRYLWPEMLRIVRELTPSWVIGENVPGIINIAGRTVCENLERAGYAVTIFNFEAAAVGAPHRRSRVFFVANTYCEGLQTRGCERQKRGEIPCGHNNVSYTDNRRRIMWWDGQLQPTEKTKRGWSYYGDRTQEYVTREWWTVEPELGRVANGIPDRVDRLKGLGNSVVPQQIYPIFKAIAKIIEQEE
jgi:DNA (cytosine-5)-methyltransferase 1